MNSDLTPENIQKVVQQIADEFHPDKIILFGSCAWGEPGPDSDVDLLVVKETNNTRELAMQIDGSIFPRPFPIDLIVYRPDQLKKTSGDYMIKEILKKGKVLYGG